MIHDTAIKNAIRNGNRKFDGKVEEYDYFVCKICGAKTGDLGSHVYMHGGTMKEYKTVFNVEHSKPRRNLDNRLGDKNPAFGHGGKYSKFSKKFIKGYDEAWHAEHTAHIKKVRLESPELFVSSVEYWIAKANGDVTKGTADYIKSQTRSLDWFIDKFGPVDGPIRHQAKTDKWINTLRNKPESEMAEINAKKLRKAGAYSKGEKILFAALQARIPDITDQKAIARDNLNHFYMYDIAYGNKIIEYHGDFWHANPEKYSPDFVNPYSKLTGQAAIDKDKLKLKVANDAGYDVLVVWESEFKKNKELVIEKCINFLTASDQSSQ